jgi:hypothetical protein
MPRRLLVVFILLAVSPVEARPVAPDATHRGAILFTGGGRTEVCTRSTAGEGA